MPDTTHPEVDAVLDVRPGVGIGPIDLGMTRTEARAAATAWGLPVEAFRRAASPRPNVDISTMSVDQIMEEFQRQGGPPDLAIGPAAVRLLRRW